MGDKSEVGEILKEDPDGPLLNIKTDRPKRVPEEETKDRQWSTKNDVVTVTENVGGGRCGNNGGRRRGALR